MKKKHYTLKGKAILHFCHRPAIFLHFRRKRKFLLHFGSMNAIRYKTCFYNGCLFLFSLHITVYKPCAFSFFRYGIRFGWYFAN
jgi:hypothetical protein